MCAHFLHIIEAQTYILKRRLSNELAQKNKTAQTIELSKLILLQDEYPGIDDSGKIIASGRYPSFKQNVAFTLRTLAELNGYGEIDLSNNGWNELKKSLKVRDRVMHPKKAEDIVISVEELESMMKGLTWYLNTIFGHMKVKAASE